MRKITLEMRISVHPIKAKLWRQRGNIKQGMSLRAIGGLVGVKEPQTIKHHLQTMVAMGAIDYIEGQYVFPKPKRRR